MCDKTHMTRQTFPIDAVRKSITRLMEEAGVKPKPLAIQIGMGETAIRDIFLAKTKSVGGAKLSLLAEHFGVSVENILAGTATTKNSTQKTNKALESNQTLKVSLSVNLPNLSALTEMFAGLLEAIDIDPTEDERAERLARSFPSAFQAIALREVSHLSVKEQNSEQHSRAAQLNRE